MRINYKVWFTEPEGRKEWLFIDEELAKKFLELKKEQFNIGPTTPYKRGAFGIAPMEVIEKEEEFYKSVLR